MEETSLANCDVMTFVATTQPEKACAFYCDVLGLSFEEDGPFALVVRTANATLRIQKVQSFEPLPFTSLGWSVEDIKATAQQLIEKGVTLTFEVRNLFDEAPPYVNITPSGNGSGGYDATAADPIGRLFAVNVRKSF